MEIRLVVRSDCTMVADCPVMLMQQKSERSRFNELCISQRSKRAIIFFPIKRDAGSVFLSLHPNHDIPAQLKFFLLEYRYPSLARLLALCRIVSTGNNRLDHRKSSRKIPPKPNLIPQDENEKGEVCLHDHLLAAKKRVADELARPQGDRSVGHDYDVLLVDVLVGKEQSWAKTKKKGKGWSSLVG
jgi:hypothetical protein